MKSPPNSGNQNTTFDNSSITSRLLSSKPLVFVGLISYSLYLWHWPVLAFAKYVFLALDPTSVIAALVASFILAMASWKWIETPIRRRVSTQGSKIFRNAMAAISILLAASFAIVLSDGARQRLSPESLTIIDGTEFKAQHFATDSLSYALEDLPRLGSAGSEPTFFVWGDSHALALASMLDSAANENGVSGCIAAHGGVPPLLDVWRPNSQDDDKYKCGTWNNQTLKVITEGKFKNVFLIAAWQSYVEQGSLAEITENQSSRTTTLEALRTGLRKTVDALHACGAEVWIFAQAPLQTFEVGRVYRNHAFYPWSPSPPPGIDQLAYESQTQEIRAMIDSLESDRTHIIHPVAEFFDAQGNSVMITQGNVLYVDTNHVSESGAQVYYGPATEELFRKLKL